MSTVLPLRWPASADTAQALGYLLTRHVPIEAQPHGARLVRQAAGWIPPEDPQLDRMDVAQAGSRIGPGVRQLPGWAWTRMPRRGQRAGDHHGVSASLQSGDKPVG